MATKFKCDVDADVQEPKSCTDSNQLEVGRGKWEVHTALGLYYFIWATAWYNPEVQLILGSRQTTETLQNIQELAENTHCQWTSKKKTFPQAQQRWGIQQTLLQQPDEDLYIVNLIAEGAC